MNRLNQFSVEFLSPVPRRRGDEPVIGVNLDNYDDRSPQARG